MTQDPNYRGRGRPPRCFDCGYFHRGACTQPAIVSPLAMKHWRPQLLPTVRLICLLCARESDGPGRCIRCGGNIVLDAA